MTNPINFQDGKFDSYSLTVKENLVKIACYPLGSITGGTGIECGHTIESPKIKDFLIAMGSDAIKEPREKVKNYEASEWQKIH